MTDRQAKKMWTSMSVYYEHGEWLYRIKDYVLERWEHRWSKWVKDHRSFEKFLETTDLRRVDLDTALYHQGLRAGKPKTSRTTRCSDRSSLLVAFTQEEPGRWLMGTFTTVYLANP